jgi:hypothetical protein
MKGIYLLFFLLLININCLLIRAQEIENATLLTVSQLETTYRIKDYPIVYYLASRDYKTVEYFELKDTLFRDTLLFFYQKYTIDSIFFKETNYSGSFNLFEAYSYKWGKKEFIILSFVNMYQMGTDQQTYYVIFQIKNNRGIIKSKFTRDSYLSKISVVKRCNTIKLKCKSWDKN